LEYWYVSVSKGTHSRLAGYWHSIGTSTSKIRSCSGKYLLLVLIGYYGIVSKIIIISRCQKIQLKDIDIQIVFDNIFKTNTS